MSDQAIQPITRHAHPGELMQAFSNPDQSWVAIDMQSRISASNDQEAILCWLKLHNSPHTFKAYKKEAVRLLAWVVNQKHKSLGTIDVNDLAEYRLFLEDPQPENYWVETAESRQSGEIRLFNGPLSERSIKLADSVVASLFNFLVSQKYLSYNPHTGLTRYKPSIKSGHIDTNRSLSKKQWTYLLSYLQSKCAETQEKEKAKWIRTRFAVLFMYGTGLRIHEMVKAKVSDIYIVDRNDVQQYWLKVLGKGNKMREVPLSQSLVSEMVDCHLAVTNCSPYTNAITPILPQLRVNRNKISADQKGFMTTNGLHFILKGFFKEVANSLKISNPDMANNINLASAHWLRHTHGTHAVDKNIPLTSIRDNLGHSNIAVTSQYVHADKDSRHKAFDGFLDE